ncbi:MAG: zinc ABC transporter substrate-binding protein [Ilumatobacter sp.]|nr:zinc ABC transporter substrate-binding protein [Ilumatobacter sp.]
MAATVALARERSPIARRPPAILSAVITTCRRRTWSAIALGVAVSLVATACGEDEGGDSVVQSCAARLAPVPVDEPLAVVTTVAPLTDLARSIADDTRASVVGVVPEGVDSHTFAPGPSAAVQLERADLVLLNGLGLEAPTKELALANLRGGAVLCELGDEVLPESEYVFDVAFPAEGGVPNPHLWTNPPMALEYAEIVHDLLASAMPDETEQLAVNLADFTARVDALDSAIRSATQTIPPEQRRLVTYHDAYAYFARDYGFGVIGAVQPSSFDEPTPQEVARLIGQIEAAGVTAIFGSEVFPSPVLEQIAAETGATYVDALRDDDLPGDPGDAGHSWFGMMRFNLTTIVEALGGDATALQALDPG